MATSGQITQARNSLARFFYKSGVAFHLIEQEDLVAAFAALGADLPNRKALAGTMLNKEHDRVSRDVWEAIDALHLVQLASDGWRRKHCGDGTPLVNLCALLPKGGSYFVTTEPARGVCKNAEWIEELHMRWAKKAFHVTACATERNWSLWGNVYPKCRSRLALERGEKLVFIKGNDKAAERKTDEEVMLTVMEAAEEEVVNM
ncbi:hypothetical protein JKP88DRAFT_228204 [Tribonema minus]|uniref:Uncharacterized protein n=1 Tax=Tribonema minus TaxID=303371 RepID=A0A835YKE6_9STRA|nr:hypothetical protein JKP88DRAFT_228204 [Tribonema minus]